MTATAKIKNLNIDQMNAVKMNIEWTGEGKAMSFTSTLTKLETTAPPPPFPNLTRQMTKPVDFRCPQCDSIIYSRRSRLCGVCSQPLPESYLFNPHEAERLGKMLETEKRRHKVWMTKITKEMVSLI